MFIRSSGTPETWSGWKWVRIRSVIESRGMPTRARRTLGVLTQSIRTTPSAPTSAMWVFSWASSGMAFDVPSKTNRAIGSTPEEDPDGDQRGKEDFDHRRRNLNERVRQDQGAEDGTGRGPGQRQVSGEVAHNDHRSRQEHQRQNPKGESSQHAGQKNGAHVVAQDPQPALRLKKPELAQVVQDDLWVRPQGHQLRRQRPLPRRPQADAVADGHHQGHQTQRRQRARQAGAEEAAVPLPQAVRPGAELGPDYAPDPGQVENVELATEQLLPIEQVNPHAQQQS